MHRTFVVAIFVSSLAYSVSPRLTSRKAVYKMLAPDVQAVCRFCGRYPQTIVSAARNLALSTARKAAFDLAHAGACGQSAARNILDGTHLQLTQAELQSLGCFSPRDPYLQRFMSQELDAALRTARAAYVAAVNTAQVDNPAPAPPPCKRGRTVRFGDVQQGPIREPTISNEGIGRLQQRWTILAKMRKVSFQRLL